MSKIEKRVGRPAKLTAEQIVDAAIAIIDDEGAEQLSLRAVAQRLSVTPMALYKHVGNREELELLIAGRLSATHRAAWEEKPPSDWRETIHRSATFYEDLFHEHPELARFPSLLTRADWNFIGVERLLSGLKQRGLDESDAIRVTYLAHLIYRGALADMNERRDGANASDVPGHSPDKLEYPTFARATEAARNMDFSVVAAVDFLADLIELLIVNRRP
ncbi:TetR/AcrR family transcriptional regulator [Pseudomonas sp. BN414]|uniref:TetR/AcrR family transcriptional regulator n=1 Tax=Pseudomonas sp. BN414 TaxID=2567888 RepID=UPI002458B8B0|nr:TetR/AcrR family transcriptional regulator [Pseudomonas sp. BN414]